MDLFITYLWKDPRIFFSVAVIIIFSICSHEFMHAFAALKAGDDTAAAAGHLTWNPFKQMGLFSLLLFCFFGLAWGQVPVDPAKMRGKHAPALVALAGPLTNLVLNVFFVLLAYTCFRLKLGNDFTVSMLLYGSTINVVLFVLNMLPVPGFDGYAVLSHFLPRFLQNSSEAVKGTVFVMIMLLFVFFNKLNTLAGMVTAFELMGLEWLIN
ncbi:MAG: site-2 protease family protein [Lentisphaeria bacterium]|nr:site-2 protease family protein [Lentisphaeria bacterium]